jgi:mediator of RNA polymerase II transcription subunit 12
VDVYAAGQESFHNHPSGIRHSCDRHLLSAAHRNITVGAIIAVLKAILVLGDTGVPAPTGPNLLDDDDDEDDDFGLGSVVGGASIRKGRGRGGGGRGANASVSDLARHTLRQICQQEWVHDRCLQVPDDLLKNGTLRDAMLTIKQAQKLLRFICYPTTGNKQEDASEDESDPDGNQDEDTRHQKAVTRIVYQLDVWNLRISVVEIKLMYHQLASNPAEINQFLDQAAEAIINVFADKEDIDDNGKAKDQRQQKLLEAHLQQQQQQLMQQKRPFRRHRPEAVVPYLVRHLKFLQSRILKLSCGVGGWSRSGGAGGSRVPMGREANFMHAPLLQTVLICIRELDLANGGGDKKERADREEQKEYLLQSLHTQLSTFLCFTKDERIYDYCGDDGAVRKLMQDSLQLR